MLNFANFILLFYEEGFGERSTVASWLCFVKFRLEQILIDTQKKLMTL